MSKSNPNKQTHTFFLLESSRNKSPTVKATATTRPSPTRSTKVSRKPVVLSSSLLRKPKAGAGVPGAGVKTCPKVKVKKEPEKTVRQIDIRPIPLKLTHVRGGSLPLRSTYVLERRVPRRYARSASPEIALLRQKVTPLSSPALVSSQKRCAVLSKLLAQARAASSSSSSSSPAPTRTEQEKNNLRNPASPTNSSGSRRILSPTLLFLLPPAATTSSIPSSTWFSKATTTPSATFSCSSKPPNTLAATTSISNAKATSTAATTSPPYPPPGESENKGRWELLLGASRIPVIQSDLKSGTSSSGRPSRSSSSISTIQRGIVCQKDCNCSRQHNSTPSLKGKVTLTTKTKERAEQRAVGGVSGDEKIKRPNDDEETKFRSDPQNRHQQRQQTAGSNNLWASSKHELSRHFMEPSGGRSGSASLSRHTEFHQTRNSTMTDKNNIYSEPGGGRNIVLRNTSSYKTKIGYRVADMYDEDPGIMSEAETSSTGFRRGGKARSSLPVVRTPSKTLERPLGLVFLQYRSETKRALLPNEITSMDTVRALFVRSFSKQLTMEYLDAMNTKIYILDPAKDIFYELEDLRDIRDRSVLRLFEPNVNGNGATPTWNDQDQYFSEPEFDSDYPTLHHIHKSKPLQRPIASSGMYATYSLPRPASRPFSPAQTAPAGHIVPAQPVPRAVGGGGGGGGIPGTQTLGAPPKPLRHSQFNKRPSTPSSPLYSPRSTTGNTFLGIRTSSDIYSTAADAYVNSPEKLYDNYGMAQNPATRSGSITPVLIDEESRVRMENMERQLANLTGLVHKALNPPTVVQPTRLYNPRLNYRDYIPTRDFRDDIDKHSSSSSASLQDDPVVLRPEGQLPQSAAAQQPLTTGQTKAQKFGKEKSVSFSDDPPELQSIHRSTVSEIKTIKPAIKSSTLPRVNQQVDRVLSTPAAVIPAPVVVSSTQVVAKKPGMAVVPVPPTGAVHYRTDLSPELFNQLRALQKKAKDLKNDIRILRRHVQAQAHQLRDSIRETFLKFKVIATLDEDWLGLKEPRLRREEEMYKMEVNKLDKDISELEKTVEDLRSHVINKRTRVNMADVENMALILSKSSKSVADLKARFPLLQENVERAVGMEMDRLAAEERFLKTEPDRLENALRRCKKLTGTLVTLKRLASVQEQRLPNSLDSGLVPSSSSSGREQGDIVDAAKNSNRKSFPGQPSTSPPFGSPTAGFGSEKNNNESLDELLDELENSKKHRLHPPSPPRRLPSYPSTESGGGSPVHPPLSIQNPMNSSYPPVPPKPTKIPPPPPPRSSSKFQNSPPINDGGSSVSESSESVNSQDVALTNRHMELLRKQKQLQEQFSRLQNLQQQQQQTAGPVVVVQAGGVVIPCNGKADQGGASAASGSTNSLKKTGSESNLRQKLSFAPSGSLGNLGTTALAAQLYETDIL